MAEDCSHRMGEKQQVQNIMYIMLPFKHKIYFDFVFQCYWNIPVTFWIS